ncbi:MAG: VF530 family DNA-binding protein [Oleispira sp.]|nr:VF530 family DNA-binding protein [Oleispira sp.]
MNDKTNYQNNPLHGVGLNKLITILSEHYGFDILYAYLNINCFKTNASIESSEKFLKKTDWAREKVESFYLYEYKSLPRASAKEFALPPRDRTIPLDQVPGLPKELSLEDAEKLREKRAKRAAEHSNGIGYHHGKRFGGEKKQRPYGNAKSRPERKSGQPFSGNAYSKSFNKKDANQDSASKKPSSGSSDPWGKHKEG